MSLRVSTGTRQIIILAIAVLLFRILYVDISNKLQTNYGLDLYACFENIISEYTIFIPMIIGDIAFVLLFGRKYDYGKYPMKRLALMFGYILSISIIVTLLVNRNELFPPQDENQDVRFMVSFLAALLSNAVIVVTADMIHYHRRTKIALVAETNKKRKAQYQYNQLKQQLNPHFLFNSLNILEYLVHTDTSRASDFIKKLASLYRYMLNNDDKMTVSLVEELQFVDLYSDLLKERFGNGFNIEKNIPDQYLDCQVIPCSLQILVENATKHNIVSEDNPLGINIFVRGGYIIVTNTLQPRLTNTETTKMGLKNINSQYIDVFDRNIIIAKHKDSFEVSLPIIAKK